MTMWFSLSNNGLFNYHGDLLNNHYKNGSKFESNHMVP